jgi:hypothetical protein
VGAALQDRRGGSRARLQRRRFSPRQYDVRGRRTQGRGPTAPLPRICIRDVQSRADSREPHVRNAGDHHRPAALPGGAISRRSLARMSRARPGR